MSRRDYFDRLSGLRDELEFEELALKVFKFQSIHNPVYAQYLETLKINIDEVNNISLIPFLPVELFKSHIVLTGDQSYSRIFSSSGTTGSEVSNHYIKDTNFYEQVFSNIFFSLYGSPSEYNILALLPSYLEREGSSLVYMMEKLIGKADPKNSGFYLHDHEKLFIVLNKLQNKKAKTMLFGVTFALLDFISSYELNFPELIVIETGGMKGRRKEVVREEAHEKLCKGFGVKQVHSEYGMTELLSQAYSKGNGIFQSPPWMKIVIRDADDPFHIADYDRSGGINIIDLANIDSCAFIATQDVGKIHADGTFNVLGRFDNSDIRGCNLMVG